MPNPSLAAFAFIASIAAAATPAPAGQVTGIELAQVTIRGRIIIRVPSRLRGAPAQQPTPVRPIKWAEKKGPKCIAADQLGGAIVAADYVDLVLRGGDRVRAELDGDCSGLGYYGGFYVKPSADGQVCAGRDSIRTRSGDQCTIRKFKKLVAKK
ncbi:hypothetical protein [Sphingomonas pruni]|uniref:hypothetical protein n=1 Tax=Sphingomonas pruni TaxID=40683 RepID=UPI000A006A07|nr:hypothetical protein [Sphingomonas pruni]